MEKSTGFLIMILSPELLTISGAQIIQDYTNEILYYHDELDIYLWGVTHWGTGWDYVLTDIPCNCGYDSKDLS